MKKRILALLLALAAALGLLTGCAPAGQEAVPAERPTHPAPAEQITQEDAAPVSAPADAVETEPETPEEPAVPAVPDEDGEYTAPEDVADYLHAYGHLPGNFITKKEAQALGWPGGGLWEYAPGKSIGGDYFGNYEGLLPEGTRYHECDVNYAGGSRGAERIIYGDDGSIYYTDDHYASFTQLY